MYLREVAVLDAGGDGLVILTIVLASLAPSAHRIDDAGHELMKVCDDISLQEVLQIAVLASTDLARVQVDQVLLASHSQPPGWLLLDAGMVEQDIYLPG